MLQPWLAPATLLLLAVPAVRPLFRGALPCSDDAAFHLLRLTQLDWLLREGVWYSRWAPHMAAGYGFPLFNFYAPLSYYAADLASFFTGNLNLGLRLTFALGILLGGLTLYRLAREYTGRTAAVIGAAAYIYAPYQGYDVYFRGNLAESFAWWLLPLALWALVRLARTRAWHWAALTGLSYAAILLTHNVFALIFSPLLVLFGLANGDWRSGMGRRTGQLGAAIGLGLGLAAFFWLPAFFERSLIHTERLLVPPVFVYWGNFVTLGELFARPLTVHPDLINPSVPRAIGLVHLLLALPALLWLRPEQRRLRGQVIFWGLTALAFVFMMLPVSRPVWDALPLVEFIQFPWRLIGAAALLFALLIAAAVEALTEITSLSGDPARVPRSPFPVPLFLLCLALLILSTAFWFDPRLCPGLSDPTVADIGRFEAETRTIGTTAKGEYLPRTVEALPAEPYRQPFTPSEGVEILRAGREPLRLSAVAAAGRPAEMTANVFAYPGWEVVIGGQKVDIKPAPVTGLITFSLPAGEHNITVSLRETPLRKAANAVSLAAAAATFTLLFFPKPTPSTRFPVPRSPFPLLAALLTLLLIAAVLWLLPRFETPLRRPGLPALENRPGQVRYWDGLRLLDAEVAAGEMAADGALPVSLWLTADRPLPAGYQSRVQLVDGDGQVWSDKDTRWPRIYRPYYDTREWPAGGYAREMLLAEAIPGTPPGRYTLELIIFDRESGRPAPLADGRTTLPLAEVELTRPAVPFTGDGRFAPEGERGNFGPLRLHSYSPDRAEADAGDPFLLTVFWEALIDPAENLTVRLELIDIKSTGVALSSSFPPVRAGWPTSVWQAGDVWRGRYGLRLPASLPAGRYRWQLCLAGADGACLGPPVPLSELAVSAPVRIFAADPPAVPVEQTLGGSATLVGADWIPCPSTPRLPCGAILQWRAAAEMATSYRVFLQLLDEGGRVVAQSDGEPAGWRRPTTGWLPGEIVLDPHTLAADLPDPPAGRYVLIAGLYDPETGQRLQTSTGVSELILLEEVDP